jgi:hypothetical protein
MTALPARMTLTLLRLRYCQLSGLDRPIALNPARRTNRMSRQYRDALDQPWIVTDKTKDGT